MVSVAAANEEYQNVRNLVEYGADPSNSLYDACKGGDMRIVNYLLEKGVDVKKNDSSKCLSIALELDHMEVFNTLIKKGADVQSVSGCFQIRPAAQNFVSHEIFKKLSEPIQWMTKPTSSPKKTFGTASSLQKRS